MDTMSVKSSIVHTLQTSPTPIIAVTVCVGRAGSPIPQRGVKPKCDSSCSPHAPFARK